MAKSTGKGNARGQRFSSRRGTNKSPDHSPTLPPTNAAKTDEWVATTIQGSDEHRSEARPSHDEIATRAYEMYLTRGASPGRDLDDWLEAERELQAR